MWWEVGVQAGVFSVFDLDAESGDLVNADYLVGIPLSARYEDWSAMLRLYHQSSHLGDEFLLRTKTQRVNLSYEAVDLRFSYEIGDVLRLYGGGGGLFHQDPSDIQPWSVQYGLELTSPWPARDAGWRPVAAADLQNHQENNWSLDASVRAGIQIDGAAADAQSSNLAGVLQRPLAQRPVLQEQDRILRHRHALPLLRGAMSQSVRDFVAAYAKAFPDEVVRVTEPVSLEYEVMALVLEYERRRRFPILLLESRARIGHPDRVQRGGEPAGAGVRPRRAGVRHSRSNTPGASRTRSSRWWCADAPFRHTRVTGRDLDLARLPIPTYFPGDAGRYLTAGMLVARDPETGVETEGYHRFQLKGPDRLGVSLHSRRRMFEYQRRAEARGQALPCAIVLGLHPLVSMGSLAYPPADVGKFEVVGGLLGEPLEVAPCSTIDLHVPAAAEIVIEGEILAGVREPEGPFGEFTGYFSRRSTQHVFVAKALSMRERPWFQSIGSGRAGDHITTLGLVREAEIHNALSRVIPNVTGVHVPLSGTSSFSAYVAIKQGRPGEAKHVIPIVLGVDHYLKLVIVVDDDIDVFDESDVMWAVATRMQADRDLVTVAGSLGALLDPSADERGVTAKLGIDATRPFGEPFADKLVMDPARMAWARALVDRPASAADRPR